MNNFLPLPPVPRISTTSSEGFSVVLPHSSVFLLDRHIYLYLMLQEVSLLDTVYTWKLCLRSDLHTGEINCIPDNFVLAYLGIKEIIILLTEQFLFGT